LWLEEEEAGGVATRQLAPVQAMEWPQQAEPMAKLMELLELWVMPASAEMIQQLMVVLDFHPIYSTGRGDLCTHIHL
jgi:hypothetical protein